MATDRELLVETLGWLKAWGFKDIPSQWNGLVGRIQRQVGTGWEARGATAPSMDRQPKEGTTQN